MTMPMTATVEAARTAYAALDFIDANPDQWDQGTYGQRLDGREYGCFAWVVVHITPGWTFTYHDIDGYVRRAVHTDGRCGFVSDVAAELLGFETFGLFMAENSRDELCRIVATIFGPRPTV